MEAAIDNNDDMQDKLTRKRTYYSWYEYDAFPGIVQRSEAFGKCIPSVISYLAQTVFEWMTKIFFFISFSLFYHNG